MGSAASSAGKKKKARVARVAVAPVKMTEEETVQFVQQTKLAALDQVEGGVFRSFRGKDGRVCSRSLSAIIDDDTEQEMLVVFTEYSLGDGLLMDNSAFIEILRDAKVLSKHDLTIHYANMIFKEHSAKHDPPKRLNFAHFREDVVPLLATKKKLSVEELLAKLCRLERRKAVEAAEARDEMNRQSSAEQPDDETSKAAHQAAQMLQSRTRQRHAGRRISFMRQCTLDRQDSRVVEEVVQARALPAEVDVAELEAVFLRYTGFCASNYEFLRCLRNKGDMERHQFVAMCMDALLVNRTSFTLRDCNEVFDKAIAIAMNPASDARHKEAVFFGKRFGFPVFRDIAVPCLVQRTHLDAKAISESFTGIPEKAMVIEKMNLDEVTGRTQDSEEKRSACGERA